MSKETKINCKHADSQLYKVLSVAQAYLVAKEVSFEIEEIRVNTNYVYFVRNTKLKLDGYIGREKITNEIAFMALDAGRLNWALQEGFTRTEAFEKVGLFIHASNMTNFLNWILGEKPYKFKGDYIKSVEGSAA